MIKDKTERLPYDPILAAQLKPPMAVNLEEAWESFLKLPSLDQAKLMIYLTTLQPNLCDSAFFVRFANRFGDLMIPQED